MIQREYGDEFFLSEEGGKEVREGIDSKELFKELERK